MKRTYAIDEIEVYWDSDRCIHTGWCWKDLNEVFDREKRPWIQLDAAKLDEIVQVIEKCPSGALSYRRLDDEAQEQLEVPASIIPWPNGPYFVRGSFEVHDRHGKTYDTSPRAALCRCGQSKNHPFCDLSHRDADFKSYPRVDEEESPHP